MPRKNKWTAAIVVTLVVAFLLGCASSSGSVQTFKMNEDVTVGKAVWRILSVEKNKQLGEGSGGGQAEGVFVAVEAQVKNNSNESLSITGIEATVTDDAGNNYEFDNRNNTTLLSALKRDNLVNQTVAPGQTAKGWLIFDVSQDAKGLKIKVRDLDIRSSKTSVVDLNLN